MVGMGFGIVSSCPVLSSDLCLLPPDWLRWSLPRPAGRTWKTSPGCVLEGGSGRQRARESPGADDAAGTGLAQEGAHRPLLATWLDQSWLWGFWGASIFR